MNDSYAWVIQYRDGSSVAQITNGVDNGSWKKVDVHNVAFIRLDPLRDGLPVHGVLVPEGATAFFTFRRGIELNLETGEQTPHSPLAIAGWERNGEEAYIYVDTEGNVAMTCNRDSLTG